MLSGGYGKGALLMALVSVALAAADYSDRSEALALEIGLETRFLPLVYLSLFGAVLLLARLDLRAARFKFTVIPSQDFAFESTSEREFHRISIVNSGRVPLTIKILLDNLTPTPDTLQGKFGMPLRPMGNSYNSDGSVLLPPGIPHSFNASVFDFSTQQLRLLHLWDQEAESILSRGTGHAEYVFEVVATALECEPKRSRYLLKREDDLNTATQMYRLTHVPSPNWRSRLSLLADRFETWLESPAYRRE